MSDVPLQMADGLGKRVSDLRGGYKLVKGSEGEGCQHRPAFRFAAQLRAGAECPRLRPPQ